MDLKKIFDDALAGKEPVIETAKGVLYMEPKEDTIVFGSATNAGIVPEYEFDYDFDMSFEANFQDMVDKVMEEEGHPVEEKLEEASEPIKEDLNIIIGFGEYRPWSGAVETYEKIEDAGLLDTFEAELEQIYPEGITQTQLNDILWFDANWALSLVGLADEEEVEESLKARRARREKSMVTENAELKDAIALYKKQGFLDTEDEEDAKAIEVLKNADYTVKVNSRGTAHVVELERMHESLTAKSLLESAEKVLGKDKIAMIDKYGRALTPEEWLENEARGLNESEE